MDTTLDGRWYYRSFRQAPPAAAECGPELLPWSPPGVLELSTGECGELMGTLRFTPEVTLRVWGRVVPASDTCPAAVEFTGSGLGSVNELKGYLVPGSDHIVGTIVCTQGDLGRQPDGTSGPFVLYPIRAGTADTHERRRA